jgi:3-oxosteroid 1-dehydrogenase
MKPTDRADACDFVVVGSGAAALTAALTAAVGGLSVAIVEKSRKIGGTSAMSGAGTWIPGNHHAQAAGVPDSAAAALTYLRSASPAGWEASEGHLWTTFVAQAPRMLAFVERHTPLRYELVEEPDPMAEQPGGVTFGRMVSPRALSRRVVGRHARALRRSTLPHIFTYRELIADVDPYHQPLRTVLRMAPTLLWRWLTDTRGQGSALIAGLLKGCLDHGCVLHTGARALRLVQDGPDGRVRGVEIEQDGARRVLAAARGVLLATGGFEWDAVLREAHFPGPFDRIGSPRTNEGDGQRMARAAGAQLDRMDQANVHPTIPTRYEGHDHGLPMVFQAEPHAIMVDRHGRRFVSEYDYNIGEAIDRRDADGAPLHLPVWMIGDRRFLRRSMPLRAYARTDPGWIRRAPTLAALAAAIGVPEDALAATVARFNRFCAEGRDADFQRGESAWQRYKAGIEPGDAIGTLGPIAQGAVRGDPAQPLDPGHQGRRAHRRPRPRAAPRRQRDRGPAMRRAGDGQPDRHAIGRRRYHDRAEHDVGICCRIHGAGQRGIARRTAGTVTSGQPFAVAA